MSNLREELSELEDIVFAFEDRFLTFCGIDSTNSLGMSEVSFSSDDVKFVWVHIEGQHIASRVSWEIFNKFHGEI